MCAENGDANWVCQVAWTWSDIDRWGSGFGRAHSACSVPGRQPCRRRPVALFFRVLRTTSMQVASRDERGPLLQPRIAPDAGGGLHGLPCPRAYRRTNTGIGLHPSAIARTLVQLRRRVCTRQAQRARPSFGSGDECGRLYMEPVPLLGGSMQFSASKLATMGNLEAGMCKDGEIAAASPVGRTIRLRRARVAFRRRPSR